MQCTKTKGTSLVVTDPKGTLVVECGKMLAAAGYEAVSYTHLDVYKRQELLGYGQLLRFFGWRSGGVSRLCQMACRKRHDQIYTQCVMNKIIAMPNNLIAFRVPKHSICFMQATNIAIKDTRR